MSRLKMHQAVPWLMVGVLAAMSCAAPQNTPNSNSISSPLSDNKYKVERQDPDDLISVMLENLPTGQPAPDSSDASVAAVTITPPAPVVTSIYVTTTTLPNTEVITPTTTITTLLDRPTVSVLVSPEEYSAWLSSNSAEASAQKTPALRHEQRDNPGMPVKPYLFEASIDCHASTMSGLSLEEIENLLSTACGSFHHFYDKESSPRIVTMKTERDIEATFQLDFDFTTQRTLSSFTFEQETCVDGFTRAIKNCNDKDGHLYQNALIFGVGHMISMTFLYSSVRTASVKRADNKEEGCLPASFAKDEEKAIQAAKEWCIKTAVWEYPKGESPWPELLSEKDGDYLAVNITNKGSGKMSVTKADCEEVFSQKPAACAIDDHSNTFKWSYTIGEAGYSIEYTPGRDQKATRTERDLAKDSDPDASTLLEDVVDEAASTELSTLANRQPKQQTVPLVMDYKKLWNREGLVVLNHTLYDCSKSSAASVCCAKGPWVPSANMTNFPDTYCSFLTQGEPSRKYDKGAQFMNIGYLGPPHMLFENALSHPNTLHRDECKVWVQRLISDCTTSVAGFTGGLMYVGGFSSWIEVQGALDGTEDFGLPE